MPPLRPGKRHGCGGKFPSGSAARRGIPVLLCALLLPLGAVAGSRTTVRVADGVYCVGRGNWGGLKPFSAAPDSNVYLISGIFVSRLYTEGFWWFVIMPACLSRCVENEIRDDVREEKRIRAQLLHWINQGQPARLAGA